MFPLTIQTIPARARLLRYRLFGAYARKQRRERWAMAADLVLGTNFASRDAWQRFRHDLCFRTGYFDFAVIGTDDIREIIDERLAELTPDDGGDDLTPAEIAQRDRLERVTEADIFDATYRAWDKWSSESVSETMSIYREEIADLAIEYAADRQR